MLLLRSDQERSCLGGKQVLPDSQQAVRGLRCSREPGAFEELGAQCRIESSGKKAMGQQEWPSSEQVTDFARKSLAPLRWQCKMILFSFQNGPSGSRVESDWDALN